jgi:RHS repeat-associated protein
VKERVRVLQMAGAKEFVTETHFHPITGQVVDKTLFDGQVLRTVHADAKQGSYAQRISVEPAWVAFLHVGAKRWLGGWFGTWSRDMLPSTVLVADVKVDPLNGLASFKFGNGLDYRKTFDLAGRVVAINQAAVADRTYGFDVGPRIRSINLGGAKDGMIKTSFDYAGFGHLKAAGPSLPRSTPKVVPSLDAAGRIIQDQHFAYRYTTSGQLQEVKTLNADSTLAKYTFNARHQRVSKEVFSADGNSAIRYFLWQGDNVAAEVDEAGKIVTQYVYLNDGAKAMPVAKIGTDVDSKKILFIHSEHRAAPIAMTDVNQKMVWQADLSEAGIAKVASNALGAMEELNLRLPGQYFDAETGLHDNFHRTYDPATGRYLQPDPLGYPDGPDPYLYASGDPVNRIDPKGLYESDIHYYSTFFLAIVAGLDYKAARVVALASQYIDDNPLTRPVDSENKLQQLLSVFNNHQQLKLYHFVLGDEAGKVRPESRNSNLGFPSSTQLTDLLGATYRATSPCAKYQFLGEYLHAFADTYSHRDSNDVPYDAIQQIAGTTYGLGHGVDLSHPDYTFNHTSYSVGQGPFGPELIAIGWNSNERRTLLMQQAVFATLSRYGGGSLVDWSDIAPVLARFNAMRISEASGDMRSKTKVLEDALNGPLRGFLPTGSYPQASQTFDFSTSAGGRYSIEQAGLNRNAFFLGLSESDIPGVCLPTGTRCKPF